MQAILINIDRSKFLLPISHSDNYEFPSYIVENKQNIIDCIKAYKTWVKDTLQPMPPMPDMAKFKEKTGIIGVPFDMRDVDLYIIDKNIDVVLEVEL